MPPLEGQEEPLRRLAKLVNNFMSRSDTGPFLEPVDWRGLELFDYPEIVTKMMDLGTIKRKLERKQYATAMECANDIKLVWSNCMAYNAEGSELFMIAKQMNRKFEDKFRRIRQEFDVGEDVTQQDEEEGEDEEPEEDEEEVEEEDLEDEEAQSDGNESAAESSKGESTRSIKSSSSGGPSLDARAELASNLILLHGLELAHVMSLLERECPKALETVDDQNQPYDDPNHIFPEKVEIVLDAIPSSLFAKVSQYAAEKAMGRKRGLTEDPPLDDVSSKRKRRKTA